jgi:hypothetical protein
LKNQVQNDNAKSEHEHLDPPVHINY